MSDLLAAADRVLAAWKCAYDELLIPMFDAESVFGEALSRDDIQQLDEAVAAAKGEPTRWTYESEEGAGAP